MPSIIPNLALDAQLKAADPQRSVWVSANAGSGKTHVLTERVIRLLLRGVKPARLLCLTYTKAAAAVMKQRVFKRLSSWVNLTDEALAAEIAKLEGHSVNEEKIKQARRLFARALDTPGGLKIQTIHAFCEALLHQFPLEANIAGHFELMDDTATELLVTEARRQFLTGFYLKKNEKAALSQAMATVLENVGDSGFNSLLSEVIAKRQAFSRITQAFSSADRWELLHKACELSPSTVKPDLLCQARSLSLFSHDSLELILKSNNRYAVNFASAMRQLANCDDQEIENIVRTAYFNDKGQPRSVKMFNNDIRAGCPTFVDEFLVKQDRACLILDQLAKLKIISVNHAAYVIIDAFLAQFTAMKKARGLLDFEDLIYATLNLLKRQGAGQWVQYKLDRGIEHILVDEAQDTSPAQWEIFQRLCEEFFSGSGQSSAERTVFAVGDEKQSIYSFQGAHPEGFAENGRQIAGKAKQAGKNFSYVSLNYSFRSTSEVLNAVDIVFSRSENYRGLSAANEKTVHQAIRLKEAGEVEFWQPLEPTLADKPDDWRQPVDQLQAPAVKLASLIAEKIALWLTSDEIIAAKNRPIQPKDILILVRKRPQIVKALARELKKRNIPVAGVDRLKLNDHIAVQDLIALGQFVLQPNDDLALASLFKAPFFSLSEDDLFAYCVNRQQSLWQNLLAAQLSPKTPVGSMVDRLRHYRRLADQVPVYEFYNVILNEDGGRRAIIARLGFEASDVLDAFVDYSLAIQKTGLPGLQSFLETLRASKAEIKREFDQSRNEVRIMTIHAAKGSESSIVFLIDSAGRNGSSGSRAQVLSVKVNGGQQGNSTLPQQFELPIWLPSTCVKPLFCQDIISEGKKQADDEYRRTLYVAMTRAEDKLVICGYTGKKSSSTTEGGRSWSTIVFDALGDNLIPVADPQSQVRAYRYCSHNSELPLTGKSDDEVVEVYPPLPDYLRKKIAQEKGLPRPLTPSKVGALIDDNDRNFTKEYRISPLISQTGSPLPPLPLFDQDHQATLLPHEKGIFIHRLLQYLPAVAESQRLNFIDRFLTKFIGGESAKTVKADILALMETAIAQNLFKRQGRSEVSLMGTVDIGGRVTPVSGTVDRIIIDEESIMIADYKTGRPPTDIKDIGERYIVQMALYRALISQLYVGKLVRSLLIFTQGPVIIDLTSERLDKAMIDLAGKPMDRTDISLTNLDEKA